MTQPHLRLTQAQIEARSQTLQARQRRLADIFRDRVSARRPDEAVLGRATDDALHRIEISTTVVVAAPEPEVVRPLRPSYNPTGQATETRDEEALVPSHHGVTHGMPATALCIGSLSGLGPMFMAPPQRTNEFRTLIPTELNGESDEEDVDEDGIPTEQGQWLDEEGVPQEQLAEGKVNSMGFLSSENAAACMIDNFIPVSDDNTDPPGYVPEFSPARLTDHTRALTRRARAVQPLIPAFSTAQPQQQQSIPVPSSGTSQSQNEEQSTPTPTISQAQYEILQQDRQQEQQQHSMSHSEKENDVGGASDDSACAASTHSCDGGVEVTIESAGQEREDEEEEEHERGEKEVDNETDVHTQARAPGLVSIMASGLQQNSRLRGLFSEQPRAGPARSDNGVDNNLAEPCSDEVTPFHMDTNSREADNAAGKADEGASSGIQADA